LMGRREISKTTLAIEQERHRDLPLVMIKPTIFLGLGVRAKRSTTSYHV
jgi:hypothetical protein